MRWTKNKQRLVRTSLRYRVRLFERQDRAYKKAFARYEKARLGGGVKEDKLKRMRDAVPPAPPYRLMEKLHYLSNRWKDDVPSKLSWWEMRLVANSLTEYRGKNKNCLSLLSEVNRLSVTLPWE